MANLPTETVQGAAIPLGGLVIPTNPNDEQVGKIAAELKRGATLPGPQLFEPGLAQLRPTVAEALAHLAPILLGSLEPGEFVTIDGYVDETGSVAFNEQLSADRAWAVRDALIAASPELEPWLLEPVGHGEDDLLDPSCRGDCPTNRAVIIQIVEP